MKAYDVYMHGRLGKEVIKRGFSWPAFFFGGLWAFVKGLPGIGLCLILVNVFLNALSADARDEKAIAFLFIYLLVMLFIGFNANSWLRSKLEKKGISFRFRLFKGNHLSVLYKKYFVRNIIKEVRLKKRNTILMLFTFVLSVFVTSVLTPSNGFCGFKFVSATPGEKAVTKLVIKTSQGTKITVLRTFGNEGIEKISVKPSVESLKSALNDKDETVKMQAQTALEDIEELNKKTKPPAKK